MGKDKPLIINDDVEKQNQRSNKKYCESWKVCVALVIGILIGFVLFAIVALGVSIIRHKHDNDNKPPYWHVDDPRFGGLIFDEEFDTLNLTRWQHEITASGGGNWEFEYYTNNRTNSYVRDGILYIKPTLTNNTFTAPGFLESGTIDLWGASPADQCTSNMDWGCERTGSASNALNAVQSARMRTVDSFSFHYGRVEVRAQLPKGDWLWPAIWMLPAQNFYADWPASGEIDIVESRGNDKLTDPNNGNKDIGDNSMGTTIHWGPYYGADMYAMTTKQYSLPNGALFSDGFHNWTLDWTPDGFNASCDGNMYLQVETGEGYWAKGMFDIKYPGSYNIWGNNSVNKDAPFDKDFYFVLNIAAGGTNGYFPTGGVSSPQGLPSYTMPWSDESSTAYAQFWNSANQWYPTWHPFEENGEKAAMKIDYIRVYEYVGDK